jgi:hypothetical protein
MGEPLPAPAKRVRGVDAEDLHFAGEESQFLHGQADGAVVGVAFDLGLELGDGEPGVDHVALELDDVDPLVAKPPRAL